MNYKYKIMNIENYIQIKSKVDRIESVSDAEFQIRYAFEKIVPQLLNDGFDPKDIIEYLSIKVYEQVEKYNLEQTEVKVDEV
jgi:hypothetical protein